MNHSKRFTLLFAIVALAWTPALLAGEPVAVDTAAQPSAFEMLLQAVIEVLMPTADTPSAMPGEVTNAGPNIIFIG